MRRNQERGTHTITVELPIEDGELVAIARQSLHGHSNGRFSSADAYQVVVHSDQSALQKSEGRFALPVVGAASRRDGAAVP